MGNYFCHMGCAQALGARTVQEDYFALDLDERPDFVAHGGRLFVVSDGMGGHESGEVASVLAVRAFRQAYYKKRPGESIPEALRRAAHMANEAVYEQGQIQGGERTMGATLAAVVLLEDDLFWLSIGDSLIFLLRRGRLMRLNTTHTYSDALREKEEESPSFIAPADLDTASANALVSYLGMDALRRMDLPSQPMRLFKGDRILLATDGLLQFLSEQQVQSVLAQEPDIQAACNQLAADIGRLAHPLQDNATVVALELEETEQSGHVAKKSPWKRRSFLVSVVLVLAVLAAAALAGGYYLLRGKEVSVKIEDSSTSLETTTSTEEQPNPDLNEGEKAEAKETSPLPEAPAESETDSAPDTGGVDAVDRNSQTTTTEKDDLNGMTHDATGQSKPDWEAVEKAVANKLPPGEEKTAGEPDAQGKEEPDSLPEENPSKDRAL